MIDIKLSHEESGYIHYVFTSPGLIATRKRIIETFAQQFGYLGEEHMDREGKRIVIDFPRRRVQLKNNPPVNKGPR